MAENEGRAVSEQPSDVVARALRVLPVLNSTGTAAPVICDLVLEVMWLREELAALVAIRKETAATSPRGEGENG